MQKTIEQLYKGELYLSEQFNVRIEGLKEARQAVFEAHEEFEGKLCRAMKDELDEMLTKHMESSCFEDIQTFVNGFKRGHG